MEGVIALSTRGAIQTVAIWSLAALWVRTEPGIVWHTFWHDGVGVTTGRPDGKPRRAGWL
ncbi:hypothetical protein KCP76_26190 (plasmid) [Salmonella enterica subsp. enterica serovar Weltevreden]|nr:hypothetical protein KCP76_26190 [Salmonella enterica subsp. enterica serovar Weltevreden]QUJ01282.1 hypothetical protein KCP73_26930 [Salmonella enterica subsp. enterica]